MCSAHWFSPLVVSLRLCTLCKSRRRVTNWYAFVPTNEENIVHVHHIVRIKKSRIVEMSVIHADSEL